MCKPNRSTRVILLILLFCHASWAVRFAYQPMDHPAVEGKRVHFTCIFKDIADDMEGKYDVIWTKDSYIISEPTNGFDLNRFSFHCHTERRHLLRIDPVKREDVGGYRCHLRYNDDIVLSSNTGKLNVREIPSDEYPVVNLGKPTYKIGEEVMARCLCEKTVPEPELKWDLTTQTLLELTIKNAANDTHTWIEATLQASTDVNGLYFECELKVEDEVAPRYNSERLHIVDDGFFKTTSKEPLPQTEKQYVTRFSPLGNGLTGSRADHDETSVEGGTLPLAYRIGIAVIYSVCVSVTFIAIILP